MVLKQKISFIILIFGLLNLTAYPQGTNRFNNSDTGRVPAAVVKAAFEEIETAVASGNVENLAGFLGPQTYFSLSNGISGYYSSSQAYYVLEEFFRINRAVSFKFDSRKFGGSSPYATGAFIYESKGKRETAQVYISLKPAGAGWKITQITIN